MSFLLWAALATAQIQTSTETATICMERHLDLWEVNKARLPDPDEADLIIDYCMEKYNEQIKKEKEEQKAKKYNHFKNR